MRARNRLKDIREGYGFSQRQMAQLLGIKDSTYAMYERGARHPSDKVLLKIKDKLKLKSIRHLYFPPEENSPF